MSKNPGRFKMQMHDNEIKIKQGTVNCPSTELNLGITLNSGQSFRWVTYKNGYRGVFAGCLWTLTQNQTHISYVVQGPLLEHKNYEDILAEYFHLDVSLEKQCKKWVASDERFKQILDKVNGVRILNQDVIENVFSFICSSNNNIQRISGMVEKLCTLFGEKICTIDNKEYYTFPTIEALTRTNVEGKLKEEKFGYRAGYIANTAKRLKEFGGREWLLNLHSKNSASYANARKQLITLPGVGPKVADCICLMSLGYLEAIPVDTHIFKIAREKYLPHLKEQKTVTPKVHTEVSNCLRELWGPLAGWAQAVVFCAQLNGAGTSTTKNQKRKRNTYKRFTTLRIKESHYE